MNRTIRLAAAALIGLVAILLSSLPAAGQDAIFVDLTAVAPGESGDPSHDGWINAFALDHSLALPSGTAATFSEIAFLKATDLSTPKLHDLTASGASVPGFVTIDVCRQFPAQECFYQLRLDTVKVASVALTSSACLDPATCPSRQTESVTLSFRKITWRYTPYENGVPGGAVEYCWDLQTNAPCSPF